VVQTGLINGWSQVVFMGTQAERRLEVISHNLANTSTIGFKQEMVNSWRSDRDPERIKKELEANPAVKQIGAFSLVRRGNQPSQLLVNFPAERDSKADLENYPYNALRPYYFMEMRATDFSQGPTHTTGNETDLALQGEGFFKVQTPNGIRYTRDGSFRINSDYQLITKEGYPLLGKSGPVSVNAVDQRFVVDLEGGIHLDGSMGDQIEMVTFTNPQGLKKEGGNLYAATDDAGGELPAENCRVLQGSIEESNVNPVAGMVDLISEQRLFESMVKTMQTFEDADGKVIRDIGRIA